MPLKINSVQLDETVGDVGAPIDGEVWYNTTIDFFRGRHAGVTESFAKDSKVVHLAGSEIITGAKDFNNNVAFNLDGGANTVRIADTGGVIIFSSRPADLHDGTGNIAIGASTADASAIFDIVSTKGGLKIPVMTAVQASAIPAPADGLMLYTTTTDATFTQVGFWRRVAGVWVYAADDSKVVHLAGTETITGTKTHDDIIIADALPTTPNTITFKPTNAGAYQFGLQGHASATAGQNTCLRIIHPTVATTYIEDCVITSGSNTVFKNFGSTVTGWVINPTNNDVNIIMRGITDDNLTVWDASTDRVGIGTNAPTMKLDVRGDVYIQEGTGAGSSASTAADDLVFSGSSANVGMSFISPAGGNTNIYFAETGNSNKAAHIQHISSVNELRLGTANINSIRLQANGHVLLDNTLTVGGGTLGTDVLLRISSTDSAARFVPMTAAQAAAITPLEGMVLTVSDTDATFTSVGGWIYENGMWNKIGNSGGSGGSQYGEMYISSSAQTTIGGTGTPVKAAGTTTAGLLNDFTHIASNRLRYDGTTTTTFLVTTAISMTAASNNQSVALYLAKNGTVETKSLISRFIGTGVDEGAAPVSMLISLATNDYVELWVENNTSTANLDITRMNMSITTA